MSYQYQAAIVSADRDALIQLLDGFMLSASLNSLRLWLQPLDRETFAAFGRRKSEDYWADDYAGEEVDRLARELSRAFGVALAVFYNDQAGSNPCSLYRAGELVREFDEPDEVWVPYAEDGTLEVGPRYPGDAVPDDIECDCIWGAIDAALAAADFPGRIAAERILDVFVSEIRPIWSYPRT